MKICVQVWVEILGFWVQGSSSKPAGSPRLLFGFKSSSLNPLIQSPRKPAVDTVKVCHTVSYEGFVDPGFQGET